MAYPSTIDSFATKSGGDTIAESHVNLLQTAVEELEAKVGVDSSAVVTSHEYLLTHLPAQAQNFDIGAFNLRGLTLTADCSVGTIPIAITSTTMCTNLNADTVDGTHLAGLQTILINSAGLLAALSDETGTGVAVFNTTPTLVTPVLGAATATSINGLIIDTTTGTLDVTNAKTLTVTGDATISATPYTPGGTDVAIADGGTGAGTAAAALVALLPSQTGNANKFLESDGAASTWQTINLATADVTGTLTVGKGGTGATAAANAASGVVVLNASSQLPAVSGALLTNLPSTARCQLFTSSGTFTSGAGITKVYITMVGGGGGGCGGETTSGIAGAGGGGGQGYIKYPITVLASTGYDVTIGAAGAGGALETSGTDGGDSIFAGVTTLTAEGGIGALYGGLDVTPGTGGGGSLNASTLTAGHAGFAGGNGADHSGGGGTKNTPGAGGGSIFGAGGAATEGSAGGAGNGNGAGGGGGDTNKIGGAGTVGFVLVEW